MNVVTRSELSADGAPLLRSEDSELLMKSFQHIQMHRSVADEEQEEMAHPTTKGTLYVTTKRIVWIGDRTAARVGYGWEMSNINLHAISRDTSAFPEPCLYCQIDGEEVEEVRFVPSNPSQLQELFEAFSKCAELNPDDDDENDGGMMMGEEGDWIYNEDEVADGARAAQISAHLDSILQISPALEMQTECGQFDDADEDDEDADGLL